jgi:hypothetical protein
MDNNAKEDKELIGVYPIYRADQAPVYIPL